MIKKIIIVKISITVVSLAPDYKLDIIKLLMFCKQICRKKIAIISQLVDIYLNILVLE